MSQNQNEKQLTLGQWLDIHMDLDAYIAKGGQLLSLQVNALETLPPTILDVIVQRMGAERLDRLGRYTLSIVDVMSAQDPTKRVGEVLSEDQLRAIWRDTDSVDPDVRREYLARMALTKRGHRLQRTPARHWTRKEHGAGYQILDGRNVVVAGCGQREYEMSLEQVEAFVAGLPS